MASSFSFQTEHLHLDHGEMVPAQIRCTPGQPLEIAVGRHPGADIVLSDRAHVALARVDPHVHFRESVMPTPDEFEADPIRDPNQSYESLQKHVAYANQHYSVRRGALAALKAGVWLTGAMGNTPWPPIGENRWRAMQEYYRQRSAIFTHVWPVMYPGVAPVPGQEEKDFGSTFGNMGLSQEARQQAYRERSGCAVSYHNDQPRSDESIETFRDRNDLPPYLMQPYYFNGETVLACQRETLRLAQEAQLKRLLTRHISTGPACEMILQARKEMGVELVAEIGLDYLYFNRDMLADRETRMINYRRPALPSKEDQRALIETALMSAQQRDPLTFIGSDHAPHPREAKAFRDNGLPGSPGTRLLELSHQIHMKLVHEHGFSLADIDWLTAMAPARHMSQYCDFPYPVGTLSEGAMANLVIYEPDTPYSIDERRMANLLEDSEYHSAYRDEALRGQVLFTIVNGAVYDVQDLILPLNVQGKENPLHRA